MDVLCYLNDNLKRYIETCSFREDITEIRLRSGNNVQLTVKGQLMAVENISVSQKELEDIFFNMCQRSVNVYENDIANGYITLENGHRVGIAGEYFYSAQAQKYLLKQVKSLNMRIAKDIRYFENQDKLFDKIPQSTLIIGPPHSGKTTLLKLYAAHLSQKNKVVICDERKEIATANANCDVISGIKKSDAISMATRTLNPDFIICDEIGDKAEAEQILSAVNTGVRFICSAHGEALNLISRRPNIKLLLENNVFARVAEVRQTGGRFLLWEVRDV